MKGFVILLAGMLVFGLALGGAFVAGTIVGGGDGDEETAATTPSIPAPTTGGQAGGGGQSLRQQLAAQAQSGNLTPEQIAQLRQQFAGGAAGAGAAGGGAAGGGFLAGSALQGTIEGIEGDVITLNTFQGTIRVTVPSEATIQVTKTGVIGDLSNGMTVAVTGERSEDGTFTAKNVIGLPEGGFRGLGGGRGAFGGGRGLGGGATGGAGGGQ